MAQPRLLAVDSAGAKIREHPLKDEHTVGSDHGNSLAIDDQTVSRRHAVIRRRAGSFELADLNSTNGTYVNGNRITAPVTIKDHDHIRFGAARYVFAVDGASYAAVRTSPARLQSRAKPILAIAALFLVGFALTEYFVNGEVAKRLRATFSNGSASQSTQRIPAEPPDRPRPESRSGETGERSNTGPVAESVPAAPAEESEAKSLLPAPQWLKRLNYYRELARENPVNEDETLSDGDRKHSRYLLENYIDLLKHGENLGSGMHMEESDKPWYTPEGAAAAAHSDVFEGCSPLDANGAIDGWMSGPFHRLSMLNPGLAAAGFGTYRKGGCWTAGLDLHQGIKPRTLPHPIEFPPDGATIALEFTKNEWPDPLTACPGYQAPAGLPITLEIGAFADTQLGDHSLQRGGEELEHCAFDAATYTNSDAATEDQGRSVLKTYGAVILIPREPLIPGERYTVSITAQGKPYTWSFTVARKAAAAGGSADE
jgi:uncharacterized protein YkwD